jgi:trimethylamine:corrinoid methyltransferase-like protein
MKEESEMSSSDPTPLPLPTYAGGTRAITTTPVVGVPRRAYADVFVPGEEALEEGELRVTVLGSGNPWATRAQASASILVEVGNPERDLLVFDLGTGSLANYASLKLPVNLLDKVFLTHLHADHTADMITLSGSYSKVGRADGPVRVWGPSGTEPRLGTKHFCEGIEAALAFAEAGIPVGLLAMPTLGTTAPATSAGALIVGDAEVISGIVLLQLAFPGAPVFHSIMKAWADPRNGNYVGYAIDSRARYAPVEMAHRWGLPSMAACFGTDSPAAGTWQAGAEVALDPLLGGLAGPELVTGMGLDRTYTLLYPEAIILDDDIYQRARHALLAEDVSDEALALDVIAGVGPGGHFLAERHTRTHMRTSLKRGLTHEPAPDGGYRDPVEVARERVAWIRANHHPEPLEPAKAAELTRILAAADREMGASG